MKYEKKPQYNLEDKLNHNPQNKYETLKSILDPTEFYKNCMYCGKIYEGNYDKVLYQNGIGPLGEEFNKYNISTGVGPCCYDQYQKQLDELKNYKVENE